MATINGSTSSSNWDFKLEVTETATSVANNTSTVKVDVYIGRLNSASYMWGAEIPVTVKCTGVANKTFTYKEPDRVNFSAGQWLKIGSVTFTGVPHNSDGSKTVTISASFTNNIEPSKGSATGSFTLTTIARASQPSCITYPNHTQNVGYFGDIISIHMNRQASTFTHRVRYAFGTSAGTCIDADTGAAATAVTNGFRWKIPESLMTLITKSTSGSGTIYVDTYNGTTLIGTKSCGFTASVPASVNPSVTMRLEDVTGVGDIYGKPVQGLSKIKATITAKVAYNSPIVFTSLNIDGAKFTNGSGSSFEATSGVLQNAGTARPVTVAVRDARGRVGSTAYDMTVLAYEPPTISRFIVHRSDGAGEPNDEGGYIYVEFAAAVTSLDNKNTATYILRHKKTTESDWTTRELTEKNNVFNISELGMIFQADSNSSYDVELEVRDRHHSFVRSTSVSTAFSLANWGEDGTSLAFGKIAEKPNTFENALSLNQLGNRYAFSTPGEAGAAGFIRMATIEVTDANADTPITFVFTSRQAISPMTVYVSLRNSTATTSAVGSVTYEGSNYDAYLSPDSDLVWGLYVKKATNYDTITLQDWYTSRTMESRVKITFPGNLVDQVPTPYYKATPARADNLLDYIYPVDSVYISYSHKNPAEMLGGTWVRITNAFLWAVDSSGAIGLTGGEKTHKLTVDEIPSHSHGSVYSGHASGTKNFAWLSSGGSAMAYGNVPTGGGGAHNNMPPYIQVSVWRRTA